VFHGITHSELDWGQYLIWDAGVGSGVSEPVFVWRAKQVDEGTGWLLATVYEPERHTSSLVVLDAMAVADGPVATVRLDHRVPFGFHGSWRPAT